jgi:hypothetical protein
MPWCHRCAHIHRCRNVEKQNTATWTRSREVQTTQHTTLSDTTTHLVKLKLAIVVQHFVAMGASLSVDGVARGVAVLLQTPLRRELLAARHALIHRLVVPSGLLHDSSVTDGDRVTPRVRGMR